jgi:tryptophan 2,3-dioxygenase
VTGPSQPGYAGYLRLPTLLEQQVGVGPPGAHDELVFIAVHQAAELWFKVLLHELADARDAMLGGDPLRPIRRLRRCHQIELLLVEQLRVLDTIEPPEFAAFRPALGTASGGQSAQFWEIEAISGAEPGWPEARLPAADVLRLRRRGREPTLWDGYLAVLARAGFDTRTAAARSRAYADVAAQRCCPRPDRALWLVGELTEALVDHDQAWSQWRGRHVLTAQRQIGAGPGTGGTAGGAYLWSRVSGRFFPELWAARGAGVEAGRATL